MQGVAEVHVASPAHKSKPLLFACFDAYVAFIFCRTVTKFRAMEKAMCSKMVQFSAPSPIETAPKEEDASDADKDDMKAIRKEFEKQFVYVSIVHGIYFTYPPILL